MMSQMSHMKSITQIESHEMGHMWDDIMHKIQFKNHGSQESVEVQILGMANMLKNYQHTGKFHEQCFLMLQGNSGA